MDLKAITAKQKAFDASHGWDFSTASGGELLQRLAFLTIALNGEAGEFSNLVKKLLREAGATKVVPEFSSNQRLREELVDVFIYTIILAYQVFGMDLEAEYLKKLAANEEKLKQFEKG